MKPSIPNPNPQTLVKETHKSIYVSKEIGGCTGYRNMQNRVDSSWLWMGLASRLMVELVFRVQGLGLKLRVEFEALNQP